jgi:uncharacterized protein (DUF2461 family)
MNQITIKIGVSVYGHKGDNFKNFVSVEKLADVSLPEQMIMGFSPEGLDYITHQLLVDAIKEYRDFKLEEKDENK